jgi:hypothetical protein
VFNGTPSALGARQHTSAYGVGILIVLQSCSRLHSKDTRGQVLHVRSGMHSKSAAALDALSYPDMSRLSRFRQKTLDKTYHESGFFGRHLISGRFYPLSTQGAPWWCACPCTRASRSSERAELETVQGIWRESCAAHGGGASKALRRKSHEYVIGKGCGTCPQYMEVIWQEHSWTSFLHFSR